MSIELSRVYITIDEIIMNAEFCPVQTTFYPLMKKSIQFLLVLTTLLFHLSIAYSKEVNYEIHYKVFNTNINGINFSVDPRIELFQSVMLLAGNPLINTADLDYKVAIFNRFAPYRQHPLFGFIKNMVRKANCLLALMHLFGTCFT